MTSLYVIVANVFFIYFGGQIMKNKKSLQTGRQTNRIMPAVFRYRMLITFFVLLLAAGVFCGSVSAYDDILSAQNLSDALNSTTDSGVGAAYVNGDGEVVLLQDVQLHYTINILASDSITLTANESNDFTIYRDFNGECLFNVILGEFIMGGNNGHNLIIDGNMTTYSRDNGASLICVDGGIFTMSDGVVLQNSNTSSSGGGVYVNGGTFTMKGDSIISGNTASFDGGGVYVYYRGTFNMEGGNIINNTAERFGGGVFMSCSGTFNPTFNHSGSATVDADNDVYLGSGPGGYANLTVINTLDSNAGALNITPKDTDHGIIIHYITGVTLPGTWTGNFALNQTWANDHPTLALGQSGNDILLGTNCTVTFWIDTTTAYPSQYNVTEALLAQPTDPTKTGNTFNGWNNNSASGTSWNFTNDRITANLDLYAKWTPNSEPISPSSGNGGNDGNDFNAGPVSAGGAFTTKDGGLTLQYPAGTSAIVTIFSNYIGGGISAPPNVSYLNLYDVYSTAQHRTPVTLVFNVDVLQLDELGLTSNQLNILHYYDGQWH